jgi:heme/copper-type cytochrome/quinol oxidase subunit 3
VVLTRGASHLAEAWRRMAIPLVVLIAFAHMAKEIAKFVTWAGFLPMAVADPSGVESGRMLAAKPLAVPPDLLPMTVVSIVSIVLVLAGTYYTWREFRLAQGTAHRSYQLPTLILASGLLFLVFGWGFLQ